MGLDRMQQLLAALAVVEADPTASAYASAAILWEISREMKERDTVSLHDGRVLTKEMVVTEARRYTP